jgi:hypothetical protein
MHEQTTGLKERTRKLQRLAKRALTLGRAEVLRLKRRPRSCVVSCCARRRPGDPDANRRRQSHPRVSAAGTAESECGGMARERPDEAR